MAAGLSRPCPLPLAQTSSRAIRGSGVCSKGLRAPLHASSGICRSVLSYLQVKHSEKIARDLGDQGTFRNSLDLAVVDYGKHILDI